MRHSVISPIRTSWLCSRLEGPVLRKTVLSADGLVQLGRKSDLDVENRLTRRHACSRDAPADDVFKLRFVTKVKCSIERGEKGTEL